MKTFVLVYNGFVQFEVNLACLFMKTKGDIITVGLDGGDVDAQEGFKVKPHMQLKDINMDDVGLFMIPGGQHRNIYNNPLLTKTLRELDQKGKVIAAICSAPLHLAKAGILDGKRYTSYDLMEFKDDFRNAIYKRKCSGRWQYRNCKSHRLCGPGYRAW